MTGKTKTMTLDACVDGNVSHLTQLVGEDYDQFSAFFQIYKHIPVGSSTIRYQTTKEFVMFEVDCEKLQKNELSELKRTYEVNGITIDIREQGLSVNIPIR